MVIPWLMGGTTLTTLPRRLASIRHSPLGIIPTRVRWDILRRTGMGCMTWLGMCGSGVGIGMELMRVEVIRVGRLRAPNG